MKRPLSKKEAQRMSDNATYALADTKKIDPESGATIPTDLGVKEAKDWVEHNKK